MAQPIAPSITRYLCIEISVVRSLAPCLELPLGPPRCHDGTMVSELVPGHGLFWPLAKLIHSYPHPHPRQYPIRQRIFAFSPARLLRRLLRCYSTLIKVAFGRHLCELTCHAHAVPFNLQRLPHGSFFSSGSALVIRTQCKRLRY